MTDLVFMSPEHVARMNELLAGSTPVLDACARLDRVYEIAYELHDGPGGTVHWVFRVDPDSGAAFSLTPPRDADVTYVGDWTETIRESRAIRDGVQIEPSLDVRGDPATLERVATAYAVAHAAAVVPIEFPQV